VRRKIFWSIIIVSLCSLVIFGVLSLYFIDDSYTKKTEIHLKSLISIIKLNPTTTASFQELAEQYSNSIGNEVRVTFVNKKGLVLGDSLSLETYQNHSNRAEIMDAFSNGVGTSIRLSETNGMTNIYYAERYNADTVIRLSVPLRESLNFILFSLPLILLSLLLAGAIALFLSGKMSKRIIQPLLDFSEKIDIATIGTRKESLLIRVPYEELLPIANRFDLLEMKLKAHLDELMNESNKIKLILDKMREGVIILNKEKDVQLINKSAVKHLGLAKFIPEKMDRLSQEIDMEKNILFYTRNVELGQAIDHVFETAETTILNSAEGTFTEKALRFYISPVADASGISGVAIIIRDVTEIIRAENIRSEFVANVSHELKTPITSIKGFAELLANEKGTANQYTKVILEQSERLLELIDDILLLSEVESKTKDSNIERINLTDLIQEVIQVETNQMKKKEITVDFSSAPIYMHANKNTIFELLLNLIDNATKYNNQGGKIEISVIDLDKEIKISVFDNGIGIPKGDINRIFERFYRVDKSRSKKSGGTGLGLSIVKHIVELYKGTVIVESEIGSYTKIVVSLPKL